MNKLWEIVENVAEKCGQNRFIYEYENDSKHSFFDLKKDAEILATWLVNNYTEVAHVGMLSESSYSFLVVMFACMRSGMVFSPLETRNSEEDILEDIHAADIDVIISYKYDKQDELCEKSGLNIWEYDELMQTLYEIQMETCTFVDRDVPDYSMLFFTSGVNGKKKCIMLSDENVYYNVSCVCNSVHFTGDNTSLLSILPFTHIYGLCCGALSALVVGAELYIMNRPELFIEGIKKYNPTMTMMTPQIIEYLKKYLQFAHSKNSTIDLKEIKKSVLNNNLSVIISGGAFLEAKTVYNLEEYGIEVLQGYGMTECSPQIASNSFCVNRPETVGKVLDGTEVKIIEGEICVKGPGVMKGYYKDPVETENFMIDGWFRTGDLGYLDEEGYLTITGRKKNLIILSNGENISAERLENMLLSYEEIDECVVQGSDSIIRAEIVSFKYIQSKDDNEKDLITKRIEDIIHEENLKLPSFARIYRWNMRGEPFKKTASQKIIRLVV